VTEVVVCALSAPEPARVHVTPAVLESFATVAVTFTAWPATAFCVPLGPRVMFIGAGTDPDPDPDEHPATKPTTSKPNHNSLFIARPPSPSSAIRMTADAFKKLKNAAWRRQGHRLARDVFRKDPLDSPSSLRSLFCPTNSLNTSPGTRMPDRLWAGRDFCVNLVPLV